MYVDGDVGFVEGENMGDVGMMDTRGEASEGDKTGDVVMVDAQGENEGENTEDVVTMDSQGDASEGNEEQTHGESQEEGMVVQNAHDDALLTQRTDTDQDDEVLRPFDFILGWFQHPSLPFNKIFDIDDTEAE